MNTNPSVYNVYWIARYCRLLPTASICTVNVSLLVFLSEMLGIEAFSISFIVDRLFSDPKCFLLKKKQKKKEVCHGISFVFPLFVFSSVIIHFQLY